MFYKWVVTTMFHYHNVQHMRISGNAYWFDPESTVPFTLLIGSIWSHLDRSVSVHVMFTLLGRSNWINLVQFRWLHVVYILEMPPPEYVDEDQVNVNTVHVHGVYSTSQCMKHWVSTCTSTTNYYSGSHKMKGTASALFEVATHHRLETGVWHS